MEDNVNDGDDDVDDSVVADVIVRLGVGVAGASAASAAVDLCPTTDCMISSKVEA